MSYARVRPRRFLAPPPNPSGLGCPCKKTLSGDDANLMDLTDPFSPAYTTPMANYPASPESGIVYVPSGPSAPAGMPGTGASASAPQVSSTWSIPTGGIPSGGTVTMPGSFGYSLDSIFGGISTSTLIFGGVGLFVAAALAMSRKGRR